VAHAGIILLTHITSHRGKILKIDIFGRRKRYVIYTEGQMQKIGHGAWVINKESL
jgi:hypothetical protein